MSGMCAAVIRYVMAVLACGLCAGCGAGPAPPAADSTPVEISCPTTPPSYAWSIRPIINRSCGPCHLTGGEQAENHNFTDYPDVFEQRTNINTQLQARLMPPEDAAAQLSDPDRTLFRQWLKCNAPNN